PSGVSLISLSLGGRRRSRTVNSWWAKAAAESPRSGEFRYWAATPSSPLRAAIKKPNTVPRGVVRPRGSLGTSGLAGSAADVGLWSCAHAGKQRRKLRESRQAPVAKRVPRRFDRKRDRCVSHW